METNRPGPTWNGMEFPLKVVRYGTEWKVIRYNVKKVLANVFAKQISCLCSQYWFDLNYEWKGHVLNATVNDKFCDGFREE